MKNSLLPVVLVLLAVNVAVASGDDGEYLFYHGYNYGSQSIYSPAFILVSGSFDCLQLTKFRNNPTKVQFRHGIRNVNWNLERPFYVIDRYGWKDFISHEVLPLSFDPDHAQWWPNWQLHVVGGGVTYVSTAEWYRYHGFPYSKTLSFLTVSLMKYGNEVVEHDTHDWPTLDSIADLYIFDPLAFVVFSIPGVPEFFAKKLNMADWSFQQLMNPVDGAISNNGQKYSMKVNLPKTEKWRAFYLFGTESLGGFSYRRNNQDNISFGAGLAAHNLRPIEPVNGVRQETVEMKWTGGIFYDRNNSLLASLIVGGPLGYIARLNVYPGVLGWDWFKPGFALLIQENDVYQVGITFPLFPVGAAFDVIE